MSFPVGTLSQAVTVGTPGSGGMLPSIQDGIDGSPPWRRRARRGRRRLVAGDADDRQAADAARRGQRVSWSWTTDHEQGRGAPLRIRPLVTERTVYLAAMRGEVQAVERETGELRWSSRPLVNSELNSDLVTDGERLFVTTRKDGDAGRGAVPAIALD
jgi:outer membrane protein assembly factor BamB